MVLIVIQKGSLAREDTYTRPQVARSDSLPTRGAFRKIAEHPVPEVTTTLNSMRETISMVFLQIQ